MQIVSIPCDLEFRRRLLAELLPLLSCGCPCYMCTCAKTEGGKANA